jgi:hypothetical protein
MLYKTHMYVISDMDSMVCILFVLAALIIVPFIIVTIIVIFVE